MSFLALVAEVSQSEVVKRTLWEWLLVVTGGITVVSGAAVIVWKVAIRPHFAEFVRQQSEVYKSVTVNGGKNSPPTLLDKVHRQGDQLTHLARMITSNDGRTKDLGDKVDLLSELVQDTRDDLHDVRGDFAAHEESGRRYLGQVEIVLRDKGIELPPAD